MNPCPSCGADLDSDNPMNFCRCPSGSTMSQPLLPCPFCGSTEVFFHTIQDGDDAGGRCVVCTNCNASSLLAFPLMDSVDEKLTEAWNRRAIEASARALAAIPAPNVEAAAWMHIDDPRRVISAMQKADAVKDGGASASSVASYTMPLIHRHEGAQQAGGVPAGFVLLPAVATEAMLRPFYQCPPDELSLAYEAMLIVARKLAPSAVQPLSEAQIEAIFHDVRHSNWKEAVRAILQAHGIVTKESST